MICRHLLIVALPVAAMLVTQPTSYAEELPTLTTLSISNIEYGVPEKAYFVLRRGDVEAVVVDNQAVDDEVLPEHKAGYSGVAILRHTKRKDNLFVPHYAGLNYEHIHDGTVPDPSAKFEPRNNPMELRVIDKHTVELYQAPTRNFRLESCLRYHMLEDGTIEMTLECIPRERKFSNGYIGLFWANYIHQPESLDIHFPGYDEGEKPEAARWIRGVTPKHGVLPTHRGPNDNRKFAHDADFPLSLVFNLSKHRYSAPWYYGISHGMAYVQIFRPRDRIRLTQSPSGGGSGNPAWDFQYYVNDYQVGQRYQMVMRAMYLPYESQEQIEKASAPHRKALGHEVGSF